MDHFYVLCGLSEVTLSSGFISFLTWLAATGLTRLSS